MRTDPTPPKNEPNPHILTHVWPLQPPIFQKLTTRPATWRWLAWWQWVVGGWWVVVVMGAGCWCTYVLVGWLCTAGTAGWLVTNTSVSVCSWQSLTKPWSYPATLCCWDFLANTSEPRPQLASIALHSDCGVSGAFYPVQGAVTGIAAFALTLAVCTIASPGRPLLHSTPVAL